MEDQTVGSKGPGRVNVMDSLEQSVSVQESEDMFLDLIPSEELGVAFSKKTLCQVISKTPLPKFLFKKRSFWYLGKGSSVEPSGHG